VHSLRVRNAITSIDSQGPKYSAWQLTQVSTAPEQSDLSEYSSSYRRRFVWSPLYVYRHGRILHHDFLHGCLRESYNLQQLLLHLTL
jgi:uncharacterized metal-binding protein